MPWRLLERCPSSSMWQRKKVGFTINFGQHEDDCWSSWASCFSWAEYVFVWPCPETMTMTMKMKSVLWHYHIFSGDQSQDAASPAPLKKDVENMEKGEVWLFRLKIKCFCPLHLLTDVFLGSPAEELQKVLLEQIDFRRRLEQEFHALKGTSPFPVFREFLLLPWRAASPSVSPLHLLLAPPHLSLSSASSAFFFR